MRTTSSPFLSDPKSSGKGRGGCPLGEPHSSEEVFPAILLRPFLSPSFRPWRGRTISVRHKRCQSPLLRSLTSGQTRRRCSSYGGSLTTPPARPRQPRIATNTIPTGSPAVDPSARHPLRGHPPAARAAASRFPGRLDGPGSHPVPGGVTHRVPCRIPADPLARPTRVSQATGSPGAADTLPAPGVTRSAAQTTRDQRGMVRVLRVPGKKAPVGRPPPRTPRTPKVKIED